jgi:hypothetical protein
MSSLRKRRQSDGLPDDHCLQDVLRGWNESLDPELRRPHVLPALARLVLPSRDGEARVAEIHGPRVLVGRYHAQSGPVDLNFPGLMDHEIYRLAAPHAMISFVAGQGWQICPMSHLASIDLNGVRISDVSHPTGIQDGDQLQIGALNCRFEVGQKTLSDWFEARKRWMSGHREPSLLLMRGGGPCGAAFTLDPSRLSLIGRSFPSQDVQPDGPWGDLAQPDWNLSGLHDFERPFVGFRHAVVGCDPSGWFVEPSTARQQTYVNRQLVEGRRVLESGDELGFGAVLASFLLPSHAIDADSNQGAP